MCSAFREIKENKLWKETEHKSFPAYCRERWQLDHSTVSHMIRASEILDDLKDFDVLPQNAAQCRPMERLTAQQRKAVWKAVLEGDETPTAKVINKKIVEQGHATERVTKETPPKEDTPLRRLAIVSSMLELITIDGDDPVTVREFIGSCRVELDRLEQAVTLRVA